MEHDRKLANPFYLKMSIFSRVVFLKSENDTRVSLSFKVKQKDSITN